MTSPLRVAIVHYHLRPGGVTRVIERAVQALQSREIATCVLTGEQPDPATKPAAHLFAIHDLAYSSDTYVSPSNLLRRLREAASRHLGAEPDLWHFHNHSLGKNAIVLTSSPKWPNPE